MKIATTYSNVYGSDTTRWIDESVAQGFRYMEISTSALPEDEEAQNALIRYALSRGLGLNLHAPFGINNITSLDESRRACSVANVKHAIDLAASHALGTVTFHPGRLSMEGEDPEENLARMMDVISDIARYAKQKRVRIGLENMERRKNELVYTVDDLNRFAPIAKDNPYFGVTVDFAHYATHGIGLPPLDGLKLPIFDVHLSQSVNGRCHHPLTVQDGIVEPQKVIRSLYDYGYDGLVILEVRSGQKESLEVLDAALAASEL